MPGDEKERGGVCASNPLHHINNGVDTKQLEVSHIAIGAVDDQPSSSTANEYFDLLLFIKIYGAAVSFSFLQIAIPLGSGGRINPSAFIIAQLLFIPWSAVNGNVSYRSVVPMLPESLTWTALITAIFTQLALLICFIYSTDDASYFMGITRGIGLTAYTAVMIIGTAMFALWQDRRYAEFINQNQPRSTGTDYQRKTVHFEPPTLNNTTLEMKPNEEKESTRKSVSPSVHPDSRASDLFRESRSSMLRVIEITAAVESNTCPHHHATITENNLLLYSCACKGSIWRTPLAPSPGGEIIPSWDLPVFRLIGFSICSIFLFKRIRF